MGDDGRKIEPRLDHHRHLVPSLENLAAIDALDREHVEHDLVPVDGNITRGNAEHRNLGAVAHIVDHVAQGAWHAGHFEADVEALGHAKVLLHVAERFLQHVHRPRRAQLLRQRQPVIIHVRDHDMTGANMMRDRRRHRPDRARAGDQHVFADHVPLQRGVGGVAERVEDRGDIEIDAIGMVPDIGVGNDDVFRESPSAVDADPARVRAEVAASRHAIAAAATDDMPLARDDHPRLVVVHIVADRDDLADEFVPDHHRHGDRLLRPFVPLIDVDVGAADGGALDADLDVVRPRLRLGHVFKPQSADRLALYQRLQNGLPGTISGHDFAPIAIR